MAFIHFRPIHGSWIGEEKGDILHRNYRNIATMRGACYLGKKQIEVGGWKCKSKHNGYGPRFGSLTSASHSNAIGVNQAGFSSSSSSESKQENAKNDFAWPHSKRPRICILGGGFGGLYTALRLESLTWPLDKKPQILLVDQSERFVFKPLLYELLSGELDVWQVAPYFTDLLSNTSVQYVKGKVKEVYAMDLSRNNRVSTFPCVGTVLLESGLNIEYDWLVLALGASTRLEAIPGATEFASPFFTLEDAIELNNKLKNLERNCFGRNEPPIRITVVGCGYAGVELAATVAERLKNRGKIQAVNTASTICPSAPSGNRESALKVLTSRNVQLFLRYFVSSVRKTSNSAEIEQNVEASLTPKISGKKESILLELQPVERGIQRQYLETDLLLWTVGTKPRMPPIISPPNKPFPLNIKGQVEIEETLQVVGFPQVFALGDIAGLRDFSDRSVPMTAQVAMQQADFAGWNLWAAINGRPLLPFRFQNLGEMMTFGKSDAVCTLSFLNSFVLEGPIANATRRLAYLYRMPSDEQRFKVGLSWVAKSTIDAISSFQDTLLEVQRN